MRRTQFLFRPDEAIDNLHYDRGHLVPLEGRTKEAHVLLRKARNPASCVQVFLPSGFGY